MDFTDVAEDADYAEAVRWAEAEKIVSGVAEGTFAPDETVTREQVAAMIYRYDRGRRIHRRLVFPADL